MDLIKIGKYIAGKRKSLGMTQKQLAEKLGISLNEFLAGEDIEIDNIEKNQKIH